jgi:hypothetical protein
VFQLESGLLHVLDARTLMGAAARPAESQT